MNAKKDIKDILDECDLPFVVRELVGGEDGMLLEKGLNTIGVKNSWKPYLGMGGALLDELGDENAQAFMRILRTIVSMKKEFYRALVSEIEKFCGVEVTDDDFMEVERLLEEKLPVERIYEILSAELPPKGEDYNGFIQFFEQVYLSTILFAEIGKNAIEMMKRTEDEDEKVGYVMTILSSLEAISNALLLPIYHGVVFSKNDYDVYLAVWKYSKDFLEDVLSISNEIDYLMSSHVFEDKMYNFAPVKEYVRRLILNVTSYIDSYSF